jgi:putative effector of murein hydrolase
MLPLLFFELVWKPIWLIVVAIPLWSAHQQIDAKTSETVLTCLMGVIFPVVIPWRYVIANYLMRRGDRLQ